MNIQQFSYVLAVVDEKNFEMAAEKCYITQSTLSTMIARFEDEIGIRIFNRKTKPVSVTAEGEQVIDRLRIILSEIDGMNNMIQELKGEMIGEFHIGIIPTIAPHLLPLFLTSFAKRFPKVNFKIREMTTAEIQNSLKLRTLDVGILALPLEDMELVEHTLYSEPFLVYDSSEGSHDSVISVQDLDYSKLCLLQEGHCLRTQVKHICELSDRFSDSDVNFDFESGSMDSLLRVTRTRKGITILPYLSALDLSGPDKEKLVAFEPPVPVRKVGVVTSQFFVKKKLLEELRNVIREAVINQIPETGEENVIMPLNS